MPLTVAQLVARLTADTSGFYRGMAVANSSMIRTGGIVSRVTAGAGIAVLGIGIASLRMAGNFEQSMNILQAVMEPTEKQMKSLSDTAISLGADMKLPNVSAKDAADAMVELGKGGLSVNQVLTSTRGTLQLGLAANLEFAESAKITARALKAFELEGSRAMDIANLFAAGANKSTAEITDLALGMQNAASQFHGAGLSIEELITSLAIMADHAVSGELAGTALKTMLVRLQGPTDKARDLMKELGIDVFNAKGEMLRMPGIIGQFQKGLKGLTQEQRENVLVTLFGTRANSAMRILLNEGVKGFRKYSGEIVGTNAAVKMTEARTKGFNGAVQGLFSQVETFAIELGTHLLPAMTDVAQALARFVQGLDAHAIAGFFGEIFNGIGATVSFIKNNDVLLSTIGALTAAFIAWRAAQMGAAAATAIMTAFTAAQNAVLALNPIGLIVLALIALAAGLVIAYKRSETFRNVVHGALHAAAVAFEFLKNIVMIVVNFIRDHWQLLVAIITGPLGIVTMLVIKYWDQIKSITMTIWNTIKGFFAKWWPLLFVVFLLPLALIYALVSRTWRRVFNITMAIWNTISGFISGVLSAVFGFFGAIWGKIGPTVTRIWDTVWSIIKRILGLIQSSVRERFNAIVETVRGIASTIYSVAKQIGQAIWDGIMDALLGLGEAIADKVGDALNGALSAAKGLIGAESPSTVFRDEVGMPIGQGIVEGVKRSLRALPQTLAHELSVATQPLTQAPTSAPALLPAMTTPATGTTIIHQHHYHGGVVQDRDFLRRIRTLEVRSERSG